MLNNILLLSMKLESIFVYDCNYRPRKNMRCISIYLCNVSRSRKILFREIKTKLCIEGVPDGIAFRQ